MKEFIEDVRAGHPRLGLNITYPAPGVVERIGPDWDWLWIDGQHGQMVYNELLSMVRACDLIKRPSFVRVPSHEFGGIGLALDMGASAVIVPLVDTPEQARAIVQAGKFPPLGGRSYGGRRPIDLLGRGYSDTANDDTMLVAQIESPLAVENAEAIAATPGIGALFLGPDDILLRRGMSMTAPRTREMLEGDMAAVSAAAHKHGKLAVTVGATPEMLSLCLEFKYDLIACGSDVMLLATGSTTKAADSRTMVETMKRKISG